jgi:hypothetical protein
LALTWLIENRYFDHSKVLGKGRGMLFDLTEWRENRAAEPLQNGSAAFVFSGRSNRKGKESVQAGGIVVAGGVYQAPYKIPRQVAVDFEPPEKQLETERSELFVRVSYTERNLISWSYKDPSIYQGL